MGGRGERVLACAGCTGAQAGSQDSRSFGAQGLHISRLVEKADGPSLPIPYKANGYALNEWLSVHATRGSW